MSTDKNKLVIIALLASFALLVMLFLSTLLQSVPYATTIISGVIIIFEIIFPLEILKYFKISPIMFNIHAHNIDTVIDTLFPPYGTQKSRPHYHALGKELIFLLKFSLLILIPYIIIFLCWQTIRAGKFGFTPSFIMSFPPQMLYGILTQIFVVALPEELFYRGFLQGILLWRWPQQRLILGLPMGWAIIITNLIFALGHFVGNGSPERLLTFFPGLLFSYIIYKNKSLFSAILFHSLCNICAQILHTSIIWR